MSGKDELSGRPVGRKRLAFLLPDMRGGGAERVALQLICEFVRGGHQVDLVLLAAEGDLMPLVPEQVRIVDLRVSRMRSALSPLMRYLRSSKPDAIQVSMWPLTVVAILAHRLVRSKARLVTSDHAALSKHYPAENKKVFLSLRWSVRLIYPLADARIVVAADAADDLARLSGIERSSLEVVYNPVAKPPPDLRASPDVEALWGNADRRIISVGTLKAQKNHNLLVRSFARGFRGCRVKLMILGEGELRPKLERLILGLGMADQIVMPGFTLDAWPYYASADLFALSSDYEGYPLVLIEALRSGLPIVSTDCKSGPREILDGGRFGTLVPVGDEQALADALVAALASEHDPERLRARAEEISGQGTSERYLELMLGPDAR